MAHGTLFLDVCRKSTSKNRESANVEFSTIFTITISRSFHTFWDGWLRKTVTNRGVKTEAAKENRMHAHVFPYSNASPKNIGCVAYGYKFRMFYLYPEPVCCWRFGARWLFSHDRSSKNRSKLWIFRRLIEKESPINTKLFLIFLTSSIKGGVANLKNSHPGLGSSWVALFVVCQHNLMDNWKLIKGSIQGQPRKANMHFCAHNLWWSLWIIYLLTAHHRRPQPYSEQYKFTPHLPFLLCNRRN